MSRSELVQLRRHKRPAPPAELLADLAPSRFLPAPELADWCRVVFVDEGGPLHNEEHSHLTDASIGVLWTNVANGRQGRRIIGQAELGRPQGAMGKWAKARAAQQVEDWFGLIPDFIMTIDAVYAAHCGDAEFCALTEHELTHMGQERDAFGLPKFTRAGRPVFGIRGHDLEEFTSIARRYGAVTPEMRAMKDALNGGPEIATARLAQACGTCLGKRAA